MRSELPPDWRQWPEDALGALREREAIMWADGIPDAMAKAMERVRIEWGRHAHPASGGRL